LSRAGRNLECQLIGVARDLTLDWPFRVNLERAAYAVSGEVFQRRIDD
jgi:hypothetical protein